MSAHRSLRVARAAGVGVDLHGDRLRLTATSPPPPDVLEAIAEHKDAIVALLQAEVGRDGWDADDWHAHFDERAAIAEHDGHLQRHHAEVQAYESTVVEYMNRTFMPSAPDRCAACGEGDRVQDPLLPFGVASTGHVWLHAGCWADSDAHRIAVAVDALAKFGIEPRALLSTDDKDFIENEVGT